MSATLHQLRCFAATMETGSFTRAAEELGLSQPSLSEQVRLLERSCGAALFIRRGRGVLPTDAGTAFHPHALAALDSLDAGLRTVGAVSRLEQGTVRFGMFGAAHLYIAGDLMSQVADEFPGLNLVLHGQNSSDVLADIRGGHLEAGLVALPVDNDPQIEVRHVARDEVVLVSGEATPPPEPVGPEELAALPLVLSEATWGDRDFTRRRLSRGVQLAGESLNVRFEVENVETALEVAARQPVYAVAARGVVRRVAPGVSRQLRTASLQPALFDDFAIVHRRGTPVSRAAAVVMELAVDLMQSATRREGAEHSPVDTSVR